MENPKTFFTIVQIISSSVMFLVSLAIHILHTNVGEMNSAYTTRTGE